jgi:hypothetical protein
MSVWSKDKQKTTSYPQGDWHRRTLRQKQQHKDGITIILMGIPVLAIPRSTLGMTTQHYNKKKGRWGQRGTLRQAQRPRGRDNYNIERNTRIGDSSLYARNDDTTTTRKGKAQARDNFRKQQGENKTTRLRRRILAKARMTVMDIPLCTRRQYTKKNERNTRIGESALYERNDDTTTRKDDSITQQGRQQQQQGQHYTATTRRKKGRTG